MRRLLATFGIVACCLMTPMIGEAQQQRSNAAQAPAQVAMDPAQARTLQALQAEVQVMKEFTQHILSTVYFALGTVLVVLIAMIGFGWYQNFRVFERDKEALRQSLIGTLKKETESGFQVLDNKATERFKSFDARIANALERTHQRLADVQLMLEASIFHAAHAPKTPRTDFMVFYHQLDAGVGLVSPGVLDHVLSTVLDYVENTARIDPPTRTHLLKLAGKVANRNAAFGERVRELLARKPE